MKKILIFFIGAVLLSSCVKRNDVYNCNCKDRNSCTCPYKDGGVEPYVYEYDIKYSDWTLVGDFNELGSYYYVDVACDQLTTEAFDHGNVTAYLFSKNASRGWIQRQLPVVQPDYAKDEYDNDVLFLNVYDFDYSEKLVRFYITPSDFQTLSTTPPDAITFRVVVEWWRTQD